MIDWIKKNPILFMILALAMAARFPDLARESLWENETWIASRIIGSSVWELIRHPVTEAPIGFELLTKLVISIFGATDFAFRLIPAVSGVLGTYLTFILSLRFHPSQAIALLAASLYAFNPQTIHFSHQFKPYVSDSCVLMALILLTERTLDQGLAPRALLRWALTIVSAFLISTPVPLMMPALGLRMLLAPGASIERRKALAAYLCGMAVFLAALYLSLFGPPRAGLYQVWGGYFPSNRELSTLVEFFAHSIRSILGFAAQWEWYGCFTSQTSIALSQVLAFFGFGSALTRRQQRPLILYFSGLFFAGFFAAVIHKVPFGGTRFSLYLVPVVLLIWSIAIWEITHGLMERFRPSWVPAILILIAIAPPWIAWKYNAAHFNRNDDRTRELIQKLRAELQPGDVLMASKLQLAFDYYAPDLVPKVFFFTQDSTKLNPGHAENALERRKDQGRIWVMYHRGFLWEGSVPDKILKEHCRLELSDTAGHPVLLRYQCATR